VTAKYLAFISHDIRGMLNAGLLLAEVITRQLANEPRFSESLADLDSMRRSMLETVAAMDRFLDAERLRRGKMPVAVSAIDLATVLQNLTRSHLYDGKSLLTIDVEAGCSVQSDRDVLQLILQNLLSNAVKYGRNREVRIRAHTRPDKAVHITVADRGPGIAPEKLQTIFAPFSRGDTHGQQGSGLGLAIARQAADLLGAKLYAESTLGEGSTFHLELPPAPPAPPSN
jgi:signal transduction histidine kinase